MSDFTRIATSRRTFLMGLGLGAASAMAGCTSGPRAQIVGVTAFADPEPQGFGHPDYSRIYGQMVDDGHVIPAVNLSKVKPGYLRREVADPTGEAPGTIVVDTANKYAYFVMPGGRAMRYGVGVGRQGFAWSGRAKVQFKKKWPTWTPPSDMIKRQPELAQYADGMEPGITNPLGARALYLYEDGRDTLYRLHGSPEYWTIGTNASSGCIRFINQDIIDLYSRAKVGAPVLVRQGGVA
ncbi:L,D-transpeptidase family protein [Jiella sp. M17.18]|uniref:L,D-transpeptidase family protein n=1 Tax=Jiella sp. M17.18 TaxID=3234247 RepID=UPI0034DEA9C7